MKENLKDSLERFEHHKLKFICREVVKFNDDFIEANIFYCSKCSKIIVEDLNGCVIRIGYNNEAIDEYCDYKEENITPKESYY